MLLFNIIRFLHQRQTDKNATAENNKLKKNVQRRKLIIARPEQIMLTSFNSKVYPRSNETIAVKKIAVV